MLRALYFFLALFVSISAVAQTPIEPVITGVNEIYLAKDDGSGKAGDPADFFVTTDVPIYCVVKLASTDVANVQMNFVAVSVPGVKADTKVVSAAFTTNGRHDRVNFTGTPEGLWIAGKYRVDIFVNKTLAGSRDLDIKNAPANAKIPAGDKIRSFTKTKPAPRTRKN